MSKKEKIFHGKDSFERMNYLYQAATMMSNTNPVLSCYYAGLCKSIAKKSVLRMEPNIKRTICKRCSLVLLPGKSSELTVETEHKRDVCKVRCSKCGFRKKYVLNENYDSWLDNEACIEDMGETDSSMMTTTSKTTTSNGTKTLAAKE